MRKGQGGVLGEVRDRRGELGGDGRQEGKIV